MTLQRPILNRSGRTKRALGVQAALEWAFRIEKAQLELRPPKDMSEEGFGFGLEYVLLQRAALGCKVDGGQYKMGSYTHPDAEVIAATVAGMPDSLGGIRMAIRVAELARAGLTPDWMPGVVPRCVPVETKRNCFESDALRVRDAVISKVRETPELTLVFNAYAESTRSAVREQVWSGPLTERVPSEGGVRGLAGSVDADVVFMAFIDCGHRPNSNAARFAFQMWAMDIGTGETAVQEGRMSDYQGGVNALFDLVVASRRGR